MLQVRQGLHVPIVRVVFVQNAESHFPLNKACFFVPQIPMDSRRDGSTEDREQDDGEAETDGENGMATAANLGSMFGLAATGEDEATGKGSTAAAANPTEFFRRLLLASLRLLVNLTNKSDRACAEVSGVTCPWGMQKQIVGCRY